MRWSCALAVALLPSAAHAEPPPDAWQLSIDGVVRGPAGGIPGAGFELGLERRVHPRFSLGGAAGWMFDQDRDADNVALPLEHIASLGASGRFQLARTTFDSEGTTMVVEGSLRSRLAMLYAWSGDAIVTPIVSSTALEGFWGTRRWGMQLAFGWAFAFGDDEPMRARPRLSDVDGIEVRIGYVLRW